MPGPTPAAKPKPAHATPAAAARAVGRSLDDFGRLSRAEKKLLKCCGAGDVAVIAKDRPEKESPANRIRADFIRFLALGGDHDNPVHERGVGLIGAWLTGPLDFEGAKVECRLQLWDCRIERVLARHARLALLDLSGSRLEDGFDGDGLSCIGGLYLSGNFHSSGAINVAGATIQGALNCNGGHLECEGEALCADRSEITEGVFLGDGFVAVGQVRIMAAAIGGDLVCDGGAIQGSDGVALALARTTIAGGAFLGAGFRAVGGEVRLLGTEIGGQLACVGGTFENPGGYALLCEHARVDNGLIFRDVTKVDGDINLASMHVASLCDDLKSWTPAAGRLVLDGFCYGDLAGAPTGAAMRIAWLELQWPEHLAGEFKPQPWEQLITVLRGSGYPEDARIIAIAKQERLRRAGRIPRGARTLHGLYGLVVGYGYRPMRLLAATASVWLVCAAAYWAGTNPAWFGAETHLLAPPPPSEPGRAAPAPDYRNFVPLIYSADVLLPVVDLGYKDEWQPVVADRHGNPLIWGQLLRFLYWFEIAFGWVAGLLLVGVLGNLIKKD